MRLSTTILAASSLVLFLLSAFMGIRSYTSYEGFAWTSPGDWMKVEILTVKSAKPLNPTSQPATGPSTQPQILEVESEWSVFKDDTIRSSGIISINGHLIFARLSNPMQPPSNESWTMAMGALPNHGTTPAAFYDTRDLSGLGYGESSTHTHIPDMNGKLFRYRYKYFVIPYWVLALLSGLLPYMWIRSYRLIAKREREGRCLHCGHDLAGQTTGPCPKCAKPIED